MALGPAFPITRSFQSWNNISVTPADFWLDAGWYGLSLALTSGGAATVLQKLAPDGVTYISVMGASVFTGTGGYVNFILPAGQYRLSLTAAVGLIGSIDLISRGGAR
jgi:hypothetical protein